MSKVLNIGAAVKIKDEIGIILGYIISQDEGCIKPRYIVVPYPEGYKNPRSLKLFDIEAVDELTSGYSDELTNNIVSALDGLLVAGQHITYEELVEYMKTHPYKMEE